MENYIWLLFFALGVLMLNQLASIARSLANAASAIERLTRPEGAVDMEPSARVAELALSRSTYVAAIKAYREQTGLGLKEAKAVVDELSRSREVPQ
jgi:ribosomal protein L7/L12